MAKYNSILHVICSLDLGGTELNALRMIRNLADKKYKNRVFVLNPNSRMMIEEFNNASGRCVVLSDASNKNIFLKFKLFNEILSSRSEGVVIIHLIGKDQILLSIAALIHGAKAIAAVAGNPPPRLGVKGRWKWRAIIYVNAALGVKLISASAYIKALIESVAPGIRTDVIPNGLDKGEFCLTRDLFTTQKVIAMVARFDPIKDHRTLLLAISELSKLKSIPPFKLWLIGSGVTLEASRILSTSLGLEGVVEFLGARSDIPYLLSRANVFAFSTTENEGFGIALIEALFAGVPIIASDVPACREVLNDGELGVLIPPNNQQELAAALASELTNPTSQNKIDSIRERSSHLYDISKITERYEEILGIL
ncbi:glycosyltransferase [Methylocystis sp. ATCC 49242]|uniref:glycosyltransferase n=1 Tax=Methylocystis sp. ATCC 49242 TaxID=622637 RepID=UPI0001F86B1F|nr:glycosyltransferase [Methylocystis sp. ATCC 49242]